MNRRSIVWTVNGLVIVVGIAVAWRALDVLALTRRVREPPAVLVRPGISVGGLNVDWTDSPRHALLFISTKCPASNKSAAALAAVSRGIAAITDVRFTALAPEPVTDLREWLDARSINVDDVVEIVNPASLGFLVTPTLLLASSDGTVTDFWGGLIDAEAGPRVLDRLKSPATAAAFDNSSYADEADSSSLDQVVRVEGARLLDVRDRAEYRTGHPEGAINIPTDELFVRARIELAGKEPVAVLCYPRSLTSCRAIGRLLRSAGVGRVILIRP